MARKLKIYNQSMSGSYTQVPTILLKGKWLEEAGFKAGEYVEVEENEDIITLQKKQLLQRKKKLNHWKNRLKNSLMRKRKS